MVQKNKEMSKKNTLLDRQRLENIKKRSREMREFKEETRSIMSECYQFVTSSEIFNSDNQSTSKSIPKQLEIYTEKVDAFRRAQRSVKMNGYASSLPLLCTAETYRNWKQQSELNDGCSDNSNSAGRDNGLLKIKREPVPEWLEEGIFMTYNIAFSK